MLSPDQQAEVLTLSRLGFSAQGIVDLTGYPIVSVRATISRSRSGGAGIRKCSTPPEKIDRRLAVECATVHARRVAYAIPHAEDSIEQHGPVRVYRLPK